MHVSDKDMEFMLIVGKYRPCDSVIIKKKKKKEDY